MGQILHGTALDYPKKKYKMLKRASQRYTVCTSN